ncbi:fibronectin type III domain-containing protein [Candidatus Woesearchaeota archaeon]|nr:fibronectin type III domain-containing protein [Candidatus Woesearchaeota archaeon]
MSGEFGPRQIRLLASFDGAADIDVRSATKVPLNQWTHVALTWDGSGTATNVHMYLDGVEVVYDTRNNGLGNRVSDAAQYFNIATQGNSPTSLPAVMDDVRIYNRALTQAEILTIYNSDDIIPPLISNVAISGIDAAAATVTWTTDELSDSQVEYGLTSSLGNASTLDTGLVTSHSVTLTSLSPSTTYSYRVKSRDANGNLGVSSIATFTTAAPDLTPPTISGVAVSSITLTSAVVMWTTNESADTQVFYGTSPTALNNFSTLDTSLVANHTVNLSGLVQATTYYYSVRSKDSSGNLATSPVASFSTVVPSTAMGACAAQPAPGAATLSAAIAAASAGDVICLSKGTYAETAVMTIDKSLSIQCQPETIIKQNTAGATLFSIIANKVNLISCTLDHSSAAGTILDLARTGGNNDVLLDGVIIQNAADTASAGLIRVLNGFKRLTIRQLQCLSCVNRVIYLQSGTSGASSDVTIEKSYLEFNKSGDNAAIYFYLPNGAGDVFNARLIDNTIIGDGSSCITATSGGAGNFYNMLVAHNDCRNSAIAGSVPYKLYNLYDSSVVANRYTPGTVGFGTSGILMAGGDNNAITGNTLNVGGNVGAATGIGIELSDVARVSVTGNSIRNYGIGGVHPVGIALDTVTANMNDITISGNSIYSTQAATNARTTCILALAFADSTVISRVSITGNTCFGPGTGGLGSDGIAIWATGAGASTNNIMVQGNILHNFTSGIRTNAGSTLTRIGINTYSSVTTNIDLNGGTATIMDTAGTSFTNATLPATANLLDGSTVYCSDCMIANPCVGNGTGAIAKYLNGVKVCN